MDLISKLKEAREVFRDAYTRSVHDQAGPFPQELMDHMMMLGVALLQTRNMGENLYRDITNRRSFYGTYHSAQIVFNKYLGTVSGAYDNEEPIIKNQLTLSEGVLGTQLEECYKILDVAVRRLER